MAIIKVYNGNPRVINLPTIGKFRPRLLPGTNEIDRSYLDKVMRPVNGKESPTARMFREPAYNVRMLTPNETVDPAPVVTPAMPPQNEEPVSAPDSLLEFEDSEARTFILKEDDPNTLIEWAKEANEHDLSDRLNLIVERMKSLGITAG